MRIVKAIEWDFEDYEKAKAAMYGQLHYGATGVAKHTPSRRGGATWCG